MDGWIGRVVGGVCRWMEWIIQRAFNKACEWVYSVVWVLCVSLSLSLF